MPLINKEDLLYSFSLLSNQFMRPSLTTLHSTNPFHAQQACIGGRNPTRAPSLHNTAVLATVFCQLSGSCLARHRIVHTVYLYPVA